MQLSALVGCVNTSNVGACVHPCEFALCQITPTVILPTKGHVPPPPERSPRPGTLPGLLVKVEDTTIVQRRIVRF